MNSVTFQVLHDTFIKLADNAYKASEDVDELCNYFLGRCEAYESAADMIASTARAYGMILTIKQSQRQLFVNELRREEAASEAFEKEVYND